MAKRKERVSSINNENANPSRPLSQLVEKLNFDACHENQDSFTFQFHNAELEKFNLGHRTEAQPSVIDTFGCSSFGSMWFEGNYNGCDSGQVRAVKQIRKLSLNACRIDLKSHLSDWVKLSKACPLLFSDTHYSHQNSLSFDRTLRCNFSETNHSSVSSKLCQFLWLVRRPSFASCCHGIHESWSNRTIYPHGNWHERD
jgi:hypothetical protein